MRVCVAVAGTKRCGPPPSPAGRGPQAPDRGAPAPLRAVARFARSVTPGAALAPLRCARPVFVARRSLAGPPPRSLSARSSPPPPAPTVVPAVRPASAGPRCAARCRLCSSCRSAAGRVGQSGCGRNAPGAGWCRVMRPCTSASSEVPRESARSPHARGGPRSRRRLLRWR